MMFDPKVIQDLRAQTGAGILDCRKVLEEAGGDCDKAIELLRKRGQKVAASKGDRETKEGIVKSYIHSNGKVGAMVEILCETDFVARNEQFQQFAHNIAMHIAASNPLYLAPSDIPVEIIAKEKEIYAEQMAGEIKPENIKEKIIEGKLGKYFQDVCLLKQPFILDDSMTIEEAVQQQIAKTGENIQLRRFSRMAL